MVAAPVPVGSCQSIGRLCGVPEAAAEPVAKQLRVGMGLVERAAQVFENSVFMGMEDGSVWRIGLFPASVDDLQCPDLILGKIDVRVGDLLPHAASQA